MDAAALAAIASPRRREILVWCGPGKWRPATSRPLCPTSRSARGHCSRAPSRRPACRVPPDHKHRFYRADRKVLGPVGKWLEGMWNDALWRLKVAVSQPRVRGDRQDDASANTADSQR